MKWSYRLGEWFGIGVKVHATFGLLLGWLGLSTLAATGSLAATLLSLAFVLVLFGFVVLHEYGHALTARHFGVRTRDITLYPIGGVAALERMPDSPRAQALIAIAGPAVNFGLAASLAGLGWLFGIDLSVANERGGAVLGMMIQANLALGLFNLLPALPMDGGRLLKALLSLRMDAAPATAIAARVARFVAVGMALYGVFAEPARPILVAIAAFVWFTAAAEARFAAARRGHPGRDTNLDLEVDREGYVRAWPVEDYEAERAARRSNRGEEPRAAAAHQRPLRVFVVRGCRSMSSG